MVEGTMAATSGLGLLLVGTFALAPAAPPATAPGPRSTEDPRARTQFGLLASGTATGVVGLGATVIGLIGLDLSLYEPCKVTDDPTEPVLTPQTRCFDEGEYARRHRNANTMMITGLAAGGTLILTSVGLITAGLVIRRQRLRDGRVSVSPTLGPNWGVRATLRF
jgi:hypothetical protein